MNEIVYVLINEAMPGYVKVGITTNLEQRIKSLDTTGIPLPFEVFYAAKVKDSKFVEGQIFGAFIDKRVRSSREFFEISPEQAVSIIKLVELENVTPKQDFVETQEDQKALNDARTRRSAFNFKMVNIPVGSELSFTHDLDKKVRVVDHKLIEMDGEIMSTSAAAQQILGVEWPVQGPLYWIYDGDTLDERRRRMEEE